MHIKNLILWRHSDAEIAGVSQQDITRALTKKGHDQAKDMAQWLKKHINKHTLVLTSPALRAIETTAHLKGNKAVVLQALSPETTIQEVLDLLQSYQGNETVVVVGHQPWLGALVAHLLAIEGHQFSLKKGAVWWLRMGAREVSKYQIYTIQTPQLFA